jgi:hypothetical protein
MDSSNWRDMLTDEERETVNLYDALQEKIRLLRENNKPLILDFKYIQNRAVQRRKYKRRNSAAADIGGKGDG